ncbi:MAG: TlpA disulfide reductase family protein [Rhodanobacter sp.]
MFGRSTTLILVLAVLAAIVGGVSQSQLQSPAITQGDPAFVGKPVPALTLFDLEGRSHALADYRGRRVLLNFWASWCGPCLEEMPTLNQAWEKFADHGVIVLGIAMDNPVRVRSFLASYPVNYQVLLGKLEAPSTSLQLGDTREILPFSTLIGADGRIMATHAGVLSPAQLENWLKGTPSQR